MGARALARCVVAMLVANESASATATPETGHSHCCATTAPGWMLFADESRTVPDCWRLDRIVVQEISICEHCVQFLFVADERGTPHVTALVFPRPSRELVETRLKIPPFDPDFSPTFANLERRYGELQANLLGPSQGRLAFRTRIRFDSVPEPERPVILDPTHRLGFRWNGSEFLLRGYLDVYLTLVS